MDTRIQEQHQKDFISTFFPSPPDHTNQNVVDSSQQQTLFNGSSTLPLGMLGHGMQPSSNTNMPLDMDLLGNLMGMQGIETQAAMMSNQQAPYNPQVLLEQQFKLTQLQQLQQLQNQIFQQQVNNNFFFTLIATGRLRGGIRRGFFTGHPVEDARFANS